MITTQNRGKTGKRKPPKGRPFPKGQSGNPGGRPKKNESLTYWLNEWLSMTGDEAANICELFAKELRKAGNEVPMAGLVTLRQVMSAINESDARNLSLMYDRNDGKLSQPLEWRNEAKESGLDPDELHRKLVEQFIAAMVRKSDTGSVAGSTSAPSRSADGGDIP